MDTPNVPINFVPASTGETFKVGTITIRIMEDGSRTDNRLGSAEFTVPPHTSGPPPHWHEMVSLAQLPVHSHAAPLLSPPSSFFSREPDVSHLGRQHDETFLVTQGTLRFHALSGATIDAKTGDYVTVPTRSPHTFSNPYDEEAKFFNTYTPAFYINYFKLLATLGAAGKPMNPEANRKAMAYFATIGVADDEMQMDKKQFYGDAEENK